MPVLLKVRGIGVFIHKSDEFAFTALYIPGLDREGSEIYVYIKCKLHLIRDLKANILIGNNIFYTKDFIINLANTSAHILSYKVTIIVNTGSHLQFLKYNVLANATRFISPKSKALVNFQWIPLIDLCDFLYQPFP